MNDRCATWKWREIPKPHFPSRQFHILPRQKLMPRAVMMRNICYRIEPTKDEIRNTVVSYTFTWIDREKVLHLLHMRGRRLPARQNLYGIGSLFYIARPSAPPKNAQPKERGTMTNDENDKRACHMLPHHPFIHPSSSSHPSISQMNINADTIILVADKFKI